MSDLISRKEVRNLMCLLHIDNTSINGKNIMKFIDELPKAYDIDKVAECLKTDSSVKLYGSGNSYNYLIPVKKAIEIVKRGDIADDVCKKLVWYRFKTKSVDDYRPLIDMKEIQMPYWCTGTAFDNSYVTIVCFLPKGEDLYKYWDDAYDIESDERTGITYTDRFPKPSWIKPVDSDSVDCSCMYIDRSRV